MKLYTNLKSALSVLSLLFFYSLNASAQFPGMAAVRAQQNQQFMNQQMQTHMLMNMNWRQNAGNGDIYKVTFKDSSKRNITSLIYQDSVTHKSFLVLVDKKFPKTDTNRFKKIYCNQTIDITIDDLELGETIIGIPTDSCWSFRVVSRPLCVYSRNAYYLTTSPKDFDKSAIIGIQLNRGPIEELTEENLRKMVESNPKALELLNKQELYKAVKRFNRDAEKATQK